MTARFFDALTTKPADALKARPVDSRPRARLRLLARAPARAMADALAVAPRRYHFSRDAIHALFSALGYPRATPVWMPSFHCGMEVRAASDAGLAPRFYRVGPDLAADAADLAARLGEAPGPVVLIHYFGFPQPDTAAVAALCRERNVPLVEDCSHAFLSLSSGRSLGTHGQAATYSLYKTLGTPDGGALRADEAELARLTGRAFTLAPPAPRPAFARDERRRRPRALAMKSSDVDGPSRHPVDEPDRDDDGPGRDEVDQPSRGDFDQPSRHDALAAEFDARVVRARRRIFEGEWRYGRGISRLSEALIRRLDPAEIVSRRRNNFLRLDALLRDARGYRPALAALPEGVCPLYLPVFVRRRGEVLFRLQAAAVEPFIFGMFAHPALDAARFPDTGRLRDELLCLPVHQDLNEDDLARTAALLRPLLAAYSA